MNIMLWTYIWNKPVTRSNRRIIGIIDQPIIGHCIIGAPLIDISHNLVLLTFSEAWWNTTFVKLCEHD